MTDDKHAGSADSKRVTREDEPRAMRDGPSVHKFGWRSPDEWDIPFTSWTMLRATDVDGREHIFQWTNGGNTRREAAQSARREGWKKERGRGWRCPNHQREPKR